MLESNDEAVLIMICKRITVLTKVINRTCKVLLREKLTYN